MRPMHVLAVAGLALAACSPTVDTRGSLPATEQVGSVKPGETTRAQVAQLLGSPSNVGTFDDKTWYYVGKKTETVAFFRPETLEQQVVIVRFDDRGVVRELVTRGMDSAQAVDPVDRTTPTAGHSLGLLEQLFGNIGRFGGGAGSSRPGRIGGGGSPF